MSNYTDTRLKTDDAAALGLAAEWLRNEATELMRGAEAVLADAEAWNNCVPWQMVEGTLATCKAYKAAAKALESRAMRLDPHYGAPDDDLPI